MSRAVGPGDSEMIEEPANEISPWVLNFYSIHTIVDLQLMILFLGSDIYLKHNIFGVTEISLLLGAAWP